MTYMNIIAEAGVNHDGKPDQAFALVDASRDSGADFVKFQTFSTKRNLTNDVPLADYQTRSVGEGSQADMVAKLELPFPVFRELADYCTKTGIKFLTTVFDEDGARFVLDELGSRYIKIGSGDLDNLPLLIQLARTQAKVILSSGMGTVGEIELALGALAWGYAGASSAPKGREYLMEAYAGAVDTGLLKDRVEVLHCTTEYPAKPESLNLSVIPMLRAALDLPVGFSDHSEGSWGAIASYALGARLLEKHITLDRSMPGPDHAASMEPAPFKEMVDQIRLLQEAMGNGVKRPHRDEIANRRIARKRVVATRDLPAGHILTLEDLTLKRSRTGRTADTIFDLVGQVLAHPVSMDGGVV